MKSADLTIVIPVNEYNDVVKGYLTRAIESIENADHGHEIKAINIVGSKEVLDQIDDTLLPSKAYKKLVNKGNTNFSGQINFAAKECKTKYFAILEYDDEFTPHWFESAAKYISFFENTPEEENKKTPTFFLPLVEAYDINTPGAQPMQYLNEAYWASSFSDEIGFIDIESLTNYMKLNVFGVIFSGGIYKTEDFLAIGGLKESFKLTFWHEFAFRAIQNTKKIYVIPKIGYNHYVKRKGSLSEDYLANMSQAEIDWWVNLATKEYFFKNDRNKTYEE